MRQAFIWTKWKYWLIIECDKGYVSWNEVTYEYWIRINTNISEVCWSLKSCKVQKSVITTNKENIAIMDKTVEKTTGNLKWISGKNGICNEREKSISL